jgi:hypothetical protein
MSQVNEAMQTLTAQWYNALVTGLGLSDQSFQLYQGPNTMVDTSQLMWNIFNAVPPKAVNNYYDPTQANNFTGVYGLILDALVANPDTSFKNCMGDYYDVWQAYLKANKPEKLNAKTISSLFNDWAMVNAPEKASCVAGLTKAYINPVNVANLMYLTADNSYAWNKTIENLEKALKSGAYKEFTLNSSTESSNTEHTWAGGRASVFFDLFSFGGGGSYDKVTTKATSAGIEISAKFGSVTTFAAGPYTQYDAQDPTLCDYSAWYNSAVMALAYTTKGPKVWNPEKPSNWDNIFGDKGTLQRMATALVVGDDITIKMKSKADYSSSEQTQIRAAAKLGFWPFFRASGGGGTDYDVQFKDDGTFECTTIIKQGNPQILGILQTPMANVF